MELHRFSGCPRDLLISLIKMSNQAWVIPQHVLSSLQYRQFTSLTLKEPVVEVSGELPRTFGPLFCNILGSYLCACALSFVGRSVFHQEPAVVRRRSGVYQLPLNGGLPHGTHSILIVFTHIIQAPACADTPKKPDIAEAAFSVACRRAFPPAGKNT